MPATQLKDYYKILKLEHTATEQDVKKAYRKLAMQYHPDTSDGDSIAEAQFYDVKEAYDVLSNVASRQLYDQERWLSGMAKRAAEKQTVTPQWILQESIKLQAHMSTIDVFRMSHQALRAYVLQLLDDDNIELLQKENDASVNEGIVQMLLESTKLLNYLDLKDVADRLIIVADDVTQMQIDNAITLRKKAWQRAKRLPYIIILITFIITVCMFFWVKK